MCELRGNIHTAMEEGQERPLPLQRLRALLQDEWPEQAAHQTKKKNGKSFNLLILDAKTN